MGDTPKIQIKGLVRFSYLAENGFAKSKQGMTGMKSMLYDPARLDRRFKLFEALALHSLHLQDDADYRVGILIGEDFPKDSHTRLKGLIDKLPQAQIITLPPMTHIRAVNAAFAEIPDDPDATHTATFRLDDDDAMHRTTTRRLREISRGIMQAGRADDPFGIAFNRGFYFDLNNADEPITEWYEKTPLGVGMAVVAPVGVQANVFRRNHRKLAEFYNCYTEISRPMFVRTVHRDNDSAATPTGRRGRMGPHKIKNALLRGFGLTYDDLRKL